MRSTLKIEVYPKWKRSTNQWEKGALGSLDINIYEQSLLVKVELPQLNSYPLFELSNPKADFEEAEKKYPELSEHFKFLQKMKAIFFKRRTCCRRFLDSMCIVHTKEKSFLDIIAIYPDYAIDEVSDFFDDLGIDPSCIK